MNRIIESTMKLISVFGLLLAFCIISPAQQPFTDSPTVTTLPPLWTAGGHSAGTDSAGQSVRIASDTLGNIAVVSGPANARNLAVTSYTASGTLRWRRTFTPTLGTCLGDWVVAAPNGDFIAGRRGETVLRRFSGLWQFLNDRSKMFLSFRDRASFYLVLQNC